MKYQTYLYLDVDLTGGLKHDTFRTNSIYDPYFGTGGTQPTGHDQWSVLFDRYNVTYAKINCQFAQNDNGVGSGSGMVIGVAATTAAVTGYTDYNEYATQRRARTKVMTDSNPKSITMGLNTNSVYGMTNRQARTNKDLVASFGSNPTSQMYFQVFVQPIDKANDQAPVKVLCTITYWCQLMHSSDLPAS